MAHLALTPDLEAARPDFAADRLAQLEELFGVEFCLVDADSGDIVHMAADAAPGDWLMRGAVCREVARQNQPQIVEEDGELSVLAIPFSEPKTSPLVAVAGFVTNAVHHAASRAQQLPTEATNERAVWMRGQKPIGSEWLLKLATLLLERDEATHRANKYHHHVEGLSANLSSTYEEISLLHRLTSNLKILDGAEYLAQMALEWLHDVVPAEGVAAYLYVHAKPDEILPDGKKAPTLLATGHCPLDKTEFQKLIARLGPEANERPLVINQPSDADWPFDSARQLLIVPLAAGEKVFGYLAAFNHSEHGEFGTVEASMLNSVATILGIHSGNIELYQEQVKLLSGMVSTLVSAIDAKDPYTCGHSNRVARVAVRLAEQLDCSDEMKNTIYLSGLLHDIGKIGIEDQVLRKEGKLTSEEYEHIKLHPELGYKILQDIRRIKDVLPGVLHHHENWNGKGYPHKLEGDEIPLMARIIAVADAFDAMGSDRPYRKGMDDAKLDSILQEGAGIQWDANVVRAFFEAREDIRKISKREREQIQLNLRQWT